MSDSITRCPNCQTAFRITDAHLKSAKGSVRCGSCLKVFNALDHLTIAPVKKPAKPRLQEKDKEADFLISDSMELNQDNYSDEFTENVLRKNAKSDEGSNLFERETELDDGDDEPTPDESWALGLMEDDDGDNDQTPQAPAETEGKVKEEQSPLIDNNATSNIDAEQKKRQESNAFDQLYNPSKFTLVDDDNAQQHTEQDQIDAYPEHNESDDEISSQDYQEYDSAIFENPDETDTADQIYQEDNYDEPNIGSANSAHFLDAIEPEPVEFAYKEKRSFWHSNILWSGLAGLAGITLLMQVAWINADTYARHESYRPYYQAVCDRIGCELPAQIDLSQISFRNIVVRGHNLDPNALRVDFLIQNSAFFEQPFPSVELVFTNTKNSALASRCFTPEEYLSGELLGRNLMPVKQPIHIELAISDPGAEAVGYQLQLCQNI